ncbi:MAG: J domain-containing protein [Chthoniobacter sp.]|nr:J domain-containing protein [Chthoniobacter sp.]
MPIKIRSRRDAATHYENLKISEKAPPEVVKAAYRALSMRWHPDKNPGDLQAARVMRTLNDAYEVLSDPVRRIEYDAILASSRHTSAPSQNSAPARPQWRRPHRRFSFWAVILDALHWGASLAIDQLRRNPRATVSVAMMAFLGFSTLLIGGLVRSAKARKLESQASYSTPISKIIPDTISPDTLVSRPPTDLRLTNPLDGKPWPTHASYLPGFVKAAMGGYSSVTVDNSRNTSDVFVKLVSAEYRHPSKVVRVCYIPARTQFTFYRIAAGRYDIRYQELEDACCLKTETFVLSETKRYLGTECTQLRVPLYGVAGKNLSVIPLDEGEFVAAVPTASH